MADMVNSMCESMTCENDALFTKSSLIGSKPHTLASVGITCNVSNTALLVCGLIKKGDIVWLTSDVVGWVVAFWQSEGVSTFYVQITALDAIHEGGALYFNEASHTNHFASADSIIDACIWVYKRPNVLKVLKPFAACVR